MARWQVLGIPIALLILVMMNLTFIEYNRQAWRNFQMRKLDVQINYATDAAVDELIDYSADLGMDYADFERIKVEPTVALDTFITVMLKGLGYSNSPENISDFKVTNLPVFVVASYDGYYLSKPTQINTSGAMDHIFSIKTPYMYKPSPSSEYSYALNLGYKDARAYNGKVISKVDAPLSEAEIRRKVSMIISDDMMKALWEHRIGRGNAINQTVYIPSSMSSINKANAFEGVTVFAYVDNLYIGGGEPLSSFGVGGSRVKHQDFIGGYTRIVNGVPIKYYTYLRLLTPDLIGKVEKVYETPHLAAMDGYYFDPAFLDAYFS